MNCPSDIELLALVEGRLDDDSSQRAELHLDNCPSCLAVVAALARGSQPEGSGGELVPSLAPTLPDGEPRYVLGEEIARGGMGRIVAARDRLLDREVALKLLRIPDALLALRLVRERRITARLSHPAITPIYDAGTLDSGEPFFAMRLIKGQSLDRAAGDAVTLEQRLRLLPAVLAVVEAVAYAHSEGVIHRDLKPHNVIVGAFGEVVLLDWGLARIQGDAEPAGCTDPDQDGALSRAGDVLGTLAYMAPEQAAGEQAEACADVYGLGAILYHLLSGEPPHDVKATDAAAGARRQPTKPLAQRAPEVPADLAAIVDRAMAELPADRYPSAGDLAGDLQRWQAGRLVRAHEYSTTQLVRRFVTRHRASLLVAAVALAVMAVVGTIAIQRVVAERRIAVQERGRAEEQQAAAENLVEFVLGDLRGKLERVGRLDAMSGVARAVLDYQQRAPEVRAPAQQLRRSRALYLAGQVALELGQLEQAELAFTASGRAATRAQDAGAVATVERCNADIGLASVQQNRGEFEQASASLDTCLSHAAGATALPVREVLLTARMRQAEVVRKSGDLDRALRLLDEAVPVAGALYDSVGPGADVARVVIELNHKRCGVLAGLADSAVQLVCTGSVTELAEARAAARPDDADAQYLLTVIQADHGRALRQVNRAQDSQRYYRTALAGARMLSQRDPTNVGWRRNVGVALDGLGHLYLQQKRFAEALEMFQASDTESVALAALVPHDVEMQRDLMVSAMAVGDTLARLEQFDQARPWLELGIERARQLVQRTPNDPVARQELATAIGQLGQLELWAGDTERAKQQLGASAAVLREVVALDHSPIARQRFATALALLAQLEEPETAMPLIREALEVLAPLRDQADEIAGMNELLEFLDAFVAPASK